MKIVILFLGMMMLTQDFSFAGCEAHYEQRLKRDRRLKTYTAGLGTVSTYIGVMTLNPYTVGAGFALTFVGLTDFRDLPIPMEKLALIQAATDPLNDSKTYIDTGISLGDNNKTTKFNYDLSSETKYALLTQYLSQVKKYWITNKTCEGKKSTQIDLKLLAQTIKRLNDSEILCPEKKWSLKKIHPKKSITRKKMLMMVAQGVCEDLKGKTNVGDPVLTSEEQKQEMIEEKNEINAEKDLQVEPTKEEAQNDGLRGLKKEVDDTMDYRDSVKEESSPQ